jgi:hypothetical protein
MIPKTDVFLLALLQSDIYLDAASTAMPQLLLRRAHSSHVPGFSSSSGSSSSVKVDFDDSELSPAARLIRMAGGWGGRFRMAHQQ